ncbi:Carotenoid cleavage dioxygenase 8 -like protein A, chloroplastic [Trichinella pseudospiralis]|uniref:Carotenoid cleavage dioxygenase 8-like protein A, chloroplastic n=1 Tax=Trichinella pseudospiralis TaxID=6337 RepID=A0A0V1FXK4_TRIPS|nr:Carotenoid cleavage dioxygenase 8 -like protein A, chloroplastic [Trichinella pseudospiralis]
MRHFFDSHPLAPGSASQFCVCLVNMLAPTTTAWLLLVFNLVSIQRVTSRNLLMSSSLQDDVDLDCESENVPSWINGYFVRQMCGSVGIGNTITYYFDCVGILGIYHFQDGAVKYSTRKYNIRASFCLKDGSFNAPAWRTLRTKINEQDYYECRKEYRSLPDDNPNRGLFAQADGSVVAHSNLPYMHKINLKYSSSGDTLVFQNKTTDDLTVVYDSDMTAVDSNGTVWGTRLGIIRVDNDSAEVRRYIYKIEKNSQEMIKVAEMTASTVNAKHCILTGEKYTYNGSSLEGMVNSIAVTKNYVIYYLFPSTFNPCPFLLTPEKFPTIPLLENFDFDKIPSPTVVDIVVIAKSDKKVGIFQNIKVKKQFINYVINAMETGTGKNLQLIVDVIKFPLDEYFKHYSARVLNGTQRYELVETSVMRYFLEPFGLYWSRKMLYPDTFLVLLEFPTINPSYRGNTSYSIFYVMLRPFNYQPAVAKFLIIKNQAYIVKKWELPYTNAEIMLTELTFAKHPDGRSEDDGVLLISAFNKITGKGLVYIVNATDMEEIGKVIVPIMTPFGFRAMFIADSSSAAFSAFHFYTAILVMLCWCLSGVIQTLPSVQRRISGQNMRFGQ